MYIPFSGFEPKIIITIDRYDNAVLTIVVGLVRVIDERTVVSQVGDAVVVDVVVAGVALAVAVDVLLVAVRQVRTVVQAVLDSISNEYLIKLQIPMQ